MATVDVTQPALDDPDRIRELMLENLFSVFNVRDPKHRAETIARNYTEDVICTDPDGTSQGRAALNARATKLLDRLPGFVFTVAGLAYVSGNLGYLAFHMGVPEQPPAVSGFDVALVRDGQIAELHTLLTARG